MSKPLVAIIGRPNVGKSTLFNKIIGERISIVKDTPGITRDRIYARADWSGREFMLIDTGGIESHQADFITFEMQRQAEVAIETAHVIIFITDIRDGVTAADIEVASMLQKSGKPVVLACNKADSPGAPPPQLYEFYSLGLGEPLPISSTHGMGLGDLLDEVVALLPESGDDEADKGMTKVSIIGKPNVGKSSLINRIIGEERVIVSDVPGTTRDAVDTYFEKDGHKYVLIDTAGMRKKGRITDEIERFSVIRALAAVDRSDVCIIMLDANDGVTEQDTKIAGYAHEEGKGMVIAVNKWDVIEKETKTMEDYRKKVREGLRFAHYAPIVFISALTGKRVGNLWGLIDFTAEQNARRVATGALNDVLGEAVSKMQPPSDKGRRLKLYYITQASTKPPTFVVFVNDKELAHFSYMRYIENQVRAAFKFEGTPLRFILRERGEAKQ